MNIQRLTKKMDVFFEKKGLRQMFKKFVRQRKCKQRGYKNSNVIKRLKTQSNEQ